MSTGDYGHFGIGPVNWSDVTSVETTDVTRADSAEWDDRDEYVLILYQNENIHRISFGRDYELRDKIYALIVDHQRYHLKSY